jgi:hypothetical protein
LKVRVHVLAVAALLTIAPVAGAQPATGVYHDAHRFGSTSFHRPPLTTVASLKKMAPVKNMADDIRKSSPRRTTARAPYGWWRSAAGVDLAGRKHR